MFSVEPFRENIYVSYLFGYTHCPFCTIVNDRVLKYDGIPYSTISVVLMYDNYKKSMELFYCLLCETLFTYSHQFEINEHSYDYYHAYIISKFEYENKVIIGTPHFESIFSLCEEIKENKLNNLTFKCTCSNNPSSPNCTFPESKYPGCYNKCEKSFALNEISELLINNPDLLLIPNNTKRAIK